MGWNERNCYAAPNVTRLVGTGHHPMEVLPPWHADEPPPYSLKEPDSPPNRSMYMPYIPQPVSLADDANM